MAFNEELLIQFMIDHYRSRFSGCKIIVRDNQSTDNTAQIALNNGCEVLEYNTNSEIDDIKLRDLKNNCWKNAATDWVLVCDVDELLDITLEDLQKEESLGSTIIKSEGYNMVNMENNYDIANIKYGERFSAYDKSYLFNKKFINEINYECGAHTSRPFGTIKYSNKAYLLYHYKLINPDFLVSRFKLTAKRLSKNNKATGMGAYNSDPEEKIRNDFEERKRKAVRIIP